MRSGEAPCDQELADEVRRVPLRSRAGRWYPARRRRKDEEGRGRTRWRGRRKDEEGRGRRTSARSRASQPSPAGGELLQTLFHAKFLHEKQWKHAEFPLGHGSLVNGRLSLSSSQHTAPIATPLPAESRIRTASPFWAVRMNLGCRRCSGKLSGGHGVVLWCGKHNGVNHAR